MSTLLTQHPPQRIVDALGPHLGPERAARLDAVAAARLGGLQIVLDDLRDPHNASAVLRTAEALGVLHVHILSRRHAFRTASRVTQGSDKWLELLRYRDVAPCVDALKARGTKLYAAVPGARLSLDDIAQLDARQPIALAFGNEHLGLSPDVVAHADGEFAIAMYGCSQSLNVSVSAAIALHHLSQARRRALGRPGDLDDDTLLRLRARYYAAELRAPELIVARHDAARHDAARLEAAERPHS